jgi:predicted PurR-regulated permease PerM
MEEPRQYIVKIETRTIINIVMIVLLLLSLYYLHELVLVILTSIVLASFNESVVRKLAVYKIPRTISVVIVYLVSLGFTFSLFYVFAPILITEVSSLVQSLGNYLPQSSVLQVFQQSNITSTQNVITTVSGTTSSLADVIRSVQTLLNSASGGFVQAVTIIFGGMLNVVLIAVITFYLSIQDHGIESFLRVITPIKHEEYIVGLWKRSERKIGLWMQGQMLLGVIMGVIVYLGLTLLGVKYALVISLLTAMLELIPFGIILAGLVGCLFAYSVGGISLAVKVFFLYTILQQFENYLIAPLIVNKVIGISPLVVILSLLIGAELAGIWGLLLGIPVAVCLLEYLSDIEKGKSIRYTS